MAASVQSSGVDQERRRFLTAATMGIVAVGATSVVTSTSASAAASWGDEAIRPFRVEVSEADLRRRLAAVRWPDKETVFDDSQGVPLAIMQELVGHWRTDYDWRMVKARLNALPSSSQRSTGWTFTSSTFVRNTMGRSGRYVSQSEGAGIVPSASPLEAFPADADRRAL